MKGIKKVRRVRFTGKRVGGLSGLLAVVLVFGMMGSNRGIMAINVDEGGNYGEYVLGTGENNMDSGGSKTGSGSDSSKLDRGSDGSEAGSGSDGSKTGSGSDSSKLDSGSDGSEADRDSGILGENVSEENKEKISIDITAKSAVLMEAGTGKIIYEKNKDERLMPASITKIMTLLLVYEAMEQGKFGLSDEVTVSAHAAGKGGSQAYLEEGEVQTVEDMIKCISIASANDASTAMAEKVAGTEEAFVVLMNEKAAELGMENTHFSNCCGLDDTLSEKEHYSSAYDIAIMSRELMQRFPQIKEYTTTWMDSIIHKTRKGESEFGLTNTNKLVRFYEGITGLKTGYTSKAGACLSATASRNGLDLIAVVMSSSQPKERFEDAKKLLDYGFANLSIYKDMGIRDEEFEVMVGRGTKESVRGKAKGEFSCIFNGKVDVKNIKRDVVLAKKLEAPVKAGDVIGKAEYEFEGKSLGSMDIYASEDVEKAGYGFYLRKMFLEYLP